MKDLRSLIKGITPARYVGTTKESGPAHLELLKMEGLTPSSSVLEIGCGALHAAVPMVEYLEPGKYVGVDPNTWLRRAPLRDPDVGKLMQDKRATFLTVKDFDVSNTGRKFNYVFAHSVLSHAADWQLNQFLKNTQKVLAPNGKILASIRLAEGNAFGSSGTPDKKDSKHKTWQYPGVSWFTLNRVKSEASLLGLSVQLKPEYTRYLTSIRRQEFHDWILFTELRFK